MSMFLRFKVKQVGIALQRVVFLLLCSSAFILSEKLTSERCFSTGVAGQSLFFRRVGKFLMFSSKVISEEFVL